MNQQSGDATRNSPFLVLHLTADRYAGDWEASLMHGRPSVVSYVCRFMTHNILGRVRERWEGADPHDWSTKYATQWR
jgi:hypothetical protein